MHRCYFVCDSSIVSFLLGVIMLCTCVLRWMCVDVELRDAILALEPDPFPLFSYKQWEK